MLASRKIRIRGRSAGGSRLPLPTQNLFELGFGRVELTDPLLAIDLHRQGNGKTQEQTFWCRLGDKLVVGLDAEGLSELGGQRHDATSSNGKGGFHIFSLAEMQQCRNASHPLTSAGRHWRRKLQFRPAPEVLRVPLQQAVKSITFHAAAHACDNTSPCSRTLLPFVWRIAVLAQGCAS